MLRSVDCVVGEPRAESSRLAHINQPPRQPHHEPADRPNNRTEPPPATPEEGAGESAEDRAGGADHQGDDGEVEGGDNSADVGHGTARLAGRRPLVIRSRRASVPAAFVRGRSCL